MQLKFERGQEPKDAMHIGVEEMLSNAGIIFTKVSGESGFFFKNNGSGLTLNSYSFSPNELRLIADYIEAHPKCATKPFPPFSMFTTSK